MPSLSVSLMLRRAALALALTAGLVSNASAQAKKDVAPAAKKEDAFQTSAPYVILIDADSGTVLFEKNADKLNPPASMSKMMTTELVLHTIQQGKLKLDDEITISENAWRRGGAPSGGSSMFAALNSRVKVDDLLRGMMIQSGNDACIALAEAIAGTEGAFADMMTKRARELGLTQSTFVNSTGIHEPEHNMTARELAKLAQHLIRTYPEFYKIYSEREFTWNKVRQQNRNPLLAAGIGADGIKTGYTKEAGYGLTASAVQNGLRLILVVNGFKTMKERAEESRKLMEWGFRNFEVRPLFAGGETVGEAKTYGGKQSRVPLISPQAIHLLVPRTMTDKLSARVFYSGPVRAPIEKGQPIGKLKVSRGDNVVLEVPLEAGESVATGTLHQRAFDAMSELVINVFRAGVDRL
jgi:serine-type D-Ala-D-Ala carboxypeptidase (penicillin-binding protein 5/6)